MNGREQSGPVIVAVKSSNKSAQAEAEAMEPRAGAEGNASRQKHAPDFEPGTRDTCAGACTTKSPSVLRRQSSEVGPYAAKPHVRFCAGARSNARPYRDTEFGRQRRKRYLSFQLYCPHPGCRSSCSVTDAIGGTAPIFASRPVNGAISRKRYLDGRLKNSVPSR